MKAACAVFAYRLCLNRCCHGGYHATVMAVHAQHKYVSDLSPSALSPPEQAQSHTCAQPSQRADVSALSETLFWADLSDSPMKLPVAPLFCSDALIQELPASFQWLCTKIWLLATTPLGTEFSTLLK